MAGYSGTRSRQAPALFLVAATLTGLVVAQVFTSSGWKTASVAEGASPRLVATVEFTTAFAPEKAADLLLGYGVQIIELRHGYPAGDRIWTGAFFLTSERTSAEIGLAYRREHAGSIEDMLANNTRLASFSAQQTELAAARASIEAARDAFSRPVVVSSRVSGTSAALDSLASDSSVTSVTLEPTRRTVRASGRSGLAAPIDGHLAFDQWLPDDVYVSIDVSSLGGRFVQQVFQWNSGRSLGFGGGDGYEPDFWLNKYDGQTYLSSCTQGNGIPCGIRVWSTDLPGSTYLDTRYLDPGWPNLVEVEYTVGTADAEFITTGRSYNTYIRTDAGDQDVDSGKITPQLTRETVPFCNNTWCMDNHQTCLPPGLWPVPVPGWNYHWNRVSNGCS